MRYSSYYLPTLKEAPQDAEVLSHKLLTRAGYIKRQSAGAYTLLPLGSKVMGKLQQLAKAVMLELDAFEMHASPFQYEGDAELRVFGNDIISYKMLPMGFFETADELSEGIRPRMGLLMPKSRRVLRGFYFFKSQSELEQYNSRLTDHLSELFNSLELNVRRIAVISEGCTGAPDISYFVPFTAGDARLVTCSGCGHTALQSDFPCKLSGAGADNGEGGKKAVERIHTPNAGTIDELVRFFECSPRDFVKTLLFMADGKVVAALVRGDRELSEPKLKDLLGCSQLVMADADTVRKVTGAAVGFAGPVGLKALIVADDEVCAMSNYITGANETDYHLKNVNMQRDFRPQLTGDIRTYSESDCCGTCGGAPTFESGLVVGRVCRQDAAYGSRNGLYFRDESGKQEPMLSMTVNLNLYALLALSIEQNSDEFGLVLPQRIAPFDVAVVVINTKDELQMSAGEKIYGRLLEKGVDVLLDDRNERAGVKFKDQELLGIPCRITVGKRIGEGIVEIKNYMSEQIEIPIEEALLKAGV